METIERWEDVISRPGFKVSSFGKVFYKNEEIKGTYINILKKERKILVAQYFISNPDYYRYVEHVDYNPLNCNASNLLWISRKQYNILSKKKICIVAIEWFNMHRDVFDNVRQLCAKMNISIDEANDILEGRFEYVKHKYRIEYQEK